MVVSSENRTRSRSQSANHASSTSLAATAIIAFGSYLEGEPPLDLAEVHRELALWLGRQTESNRRMLEAQLKTFSWGLVLLLVEIVGAILALGDVASG